MVEQEGHGVREDFAQLLCQSSTRKRGLGNHCSDKNSVDLSGNATLQAADDLSLGFAFLRAPDDVSSGTLIPAHSLCGYDVQRTIWVWV